MSIADVKPGGWAEGERLRSSQANDIRAELLKCIDGVGGGTYTPSATIGIDDLTVTGTERLKYGTRSITKTLPLASFSVGAFAWQGAGASDLFYAQTVNGSTLMYFPLPLPCTGTLTSVYMAVQGASGHGALPSLPEVFVYRRLAASSTTTETYQQVDTSANVANYEVTHAITVSGIDEPLTGGAQWFAAIRGETGGNYVAGLKVTGLVATVEFTTQPEW